MSGIAHPKGRLPARVYWFRRLLALLVIVVVVAGAWWLFTRVQGSSSPSTHPPAGSSSSPPVTQSQSPSPSTSSGTYPACPASAIKVTVSTDASTYPAGREPKFTLAVENKGTATCTRDVGPLALELTVTSGGVHVWSSDDCSPGGASAIRTFGPGDRWTQVVQWSRQRSAPGCPSGQPTASPGAYQVVARNLTVDSPPTSFALQ